ncbi:MAG TPA: sugar phosphate isomerase/epimerase [Gemmatimonadaceae bacterium]|jgi:sugar phosphate isomerase/epimerase
MKRRTFVQVLGATAAGAMLSGRKAGAEPGTRSARKLNHVGLELYSVRHAMRQDPERTLAGVRAAGYDEVELLWSMDNFGRTTKQVKDSLKLEGLRAPSAHVNPAILTDNWDKHLEDAHALGMTYIIVPSLDVKTLDEWKRWADTMNTAGAAARKANLWLAFHNEAEHMKPIDGQIPYDVFIARLDPKVTRLQLDVGNMIIGGGDPMAYLNKHKERYWSFHVKDVVPDKTKDTELGTGIVNFKQLFADIPNLSEKPCYVEDESPADELAAARQNCAYLKKLTF